MGLDKFTKQGYEKFSIEFDFSENMDDSEVVTTVNVFAIDNAEVDVSSTIVSNVQGDGAKSGLCMIQAGDELSSPYKITCRIVTDSTHQWEKDVQMKIKEQ